MSVCFNVFFCYVKLISKEENVAVPIWVYEEVINFKSDTSSDGEANYVMLLPW